MDNHLSSKCQECFEYVSKTSWKQVNKNSLTWWYVLKKSWRHLCKTSWRCLKDAFVRPLEDVLKMSWRRLSKTFWGCLKDILARLEEVLKTSWKRLEDVLKMYNQDECWIYSRHLEDVFWRRRTKANMFVLMKTPEDFFWRKQKKTKDTFIKTHVCWVKTIMSK